MDADNFVTTNTCETEPTANPCGHRCFPDYWTHYPISEVSGPAICECPICHAMWIEAEWDALAAKGGA